MHPILLALIAGLCTGLGALLSFLFKPTKIFVSVSVGFAGGIILILAFLGLLQESLTINHFSAIVGFTTGSLLILILDHFLPHIKFSLFKKRVSDKRIFKTALLIAIGIILHNLPEGLAIAVGFYHLPALGLIVTLAIALHNIPEGIVVSLPIILAGDSRKKALTISFLTGLAEPLGAFIGLLLLSLISSLIPFALAFAAGVMVYLTIDELLPMARYYGHPHGMGLGVVVGGVVALLILIMI